MSDESPEEVYRRQQWIDAISIGEYTEAEEIGWDRRDPPTRVRSCPRHPRRQSRRPCRRVMTRTREALLEPTHEEQEQ